uniref:REPAT44 n=1 Tax=Spodoptera exigua TaxID=7107 RepID=I0B5W4_SPOEX|nr:REPAT44 [Spodoptera exigua]
MESDQMTTRPHVWGSYGPNDRLISRTVHVISALTLFTNDQEVTYRGHEKTNITSIVVQENGLNGFSTQVDLLDGGLYHNFVTIGLKAGRSYTINKDISIYATINCFNN